MLQTVKKRDGRIVGYTEEKVKCALRKAMYETDKGVDETLIQKITDKVTMNEASTLGVEDIQDIIEKELLKSARKDVAKLYITYRHKRDVARKAKTREIFFEIINAEKNDITRENANMNADTPAGMMMKFASETTKPFVNDYLLADDVREAFEGNYIHIHDADMYPSKSLTCLEDNTNITIMLEDGHPMFTEMKYFDKFFDSEPTQDPTLVIFDSSDEDIMIEGRNGWTRVLNVSRRYMSDEDTFFRLGNENTEEELHVTGTHQIPVVDKNDGLTILKTVYEIQIGDLLIKDGLDQLVEVTFKDEISKDGIIVYDIETEDHYFVANGYVVHNCVQHPLDKILNDGFMAGHGESRPAKRIETASVISCISMETAQNEMHGGQAIPAFDFYMAPFVRKTYIEEIKKIEELMGEDLSELYDADIKDYEARELDGLKGVERYKQQAINQTVQRVHQAMEAFIHNMNSIHSRGGNQVVFSSINYGTDTSAEGRCVIRELLKSTYRGVGNGSTAIFPIQIWKKKRGVSYLPEDPNYDLYKLACKVTARRFFPNFLNLDATFNQDSDWDENDPKRYEHEVATMGCRTRVFENRFGPKTSIGRGNLSFTTINIVKLAIECMNIENKEERINMFFAKLDHMLDIAAKQLNDRFEFQKTALVKQFPLLMSKLWIGSEKLSPNDTIESVINQGTLGIGFIGLAECLIALIGKHHGESEEAQELGLKIITYMRDRVNDFCEKYQHNYSVLATPAEGLSGKFTKKDRKQFGVIPGVTDKEYYTNSNHVPVYYHCSPRHKAEIEAPYHNITRGGHIFYVEIDGDATHNPEAIMNIVDLMDEYNIGYGSVNHNRNRCMDCGYEDATEGLKVCPKCGSTHIDTLQRITGYLVGTTDRWNSGKIAELNDRVVHK